MKDTKLTIQVRDALRELHFRRGKKPYSMQAIRRMLLLKTNGETMLRDQQIVETLEQMKDVTAFKIGVSDGKDIVGYDFTR